MLIHITPVLYLPGRAVELVDVIVQPLGLHLRGGIELLTGRPYPNKHFAVGCRSTRRKKAYFGILIDAPQAITRFQYNARWAAGADLLIHHRINYNVSDHDFDLATDFHVLWNSFSHERGVWSRRFPADAPDMLDDRLTTTLKVIPQGPVRDTDVLNDEGLIVGRTQDFAIPTVERERYLMVRSERDYERLPPLDSAFHSNAPEDGGCPVNGPLPDEESNPVTGHTPNRTWVYEPDEWTKIPSHEWPALMVHNSTGCLFEVYPPEDSRHRRVAVAQLEARFVAMTGGQPRPPNFIIKMIGSTAITAYQRLMFDDFSPQHDRSRN